MTLKGRHWVALWLAFLLLTLVWVQARQTAALVSADQLNNLRAARAALEASKAEQTARIRAAKSRSVLVPRAESLGLRAAVDSEIVFLELLGG